MGAEKIVKSSGNLIFAVENNVDAGLTVNTNVMNTATEIVSNAEGHSSVSNDAFMKAPKTSHDNSCPSYRAFYSSPTLEEAHTSRDTALKTERLSGI